MRPEFHQSMEKVKLQTEIIKIILDAEKASGLGVKTTMKKDKQGQNSHKKKASRIPLNQWKRLSCKQRLSN